MSHDKIKDAARQRMAQTGEPYAAARRHVTGGGSTSGGDGAPAGEPQRFAISYDGMDRFSRWADTLLGGGPNGGRIEIHADELRLRMADFEVDVPRACVREAALSSFRTKGTIGVHARGGTWLANGSATGLVEIKIDPASRTERCLSSMFRRAEVNALIVSLVDPEGFIAAVGRWLTQHGRSGDFPA